MIQNLFCICVHAIQCVLKYNFLSLSLSVAAIRRWTEKNWKEKTAILTPCNSFTRPEMYKTFRKRRLNNLENSRRLDSPRLWTKEKVLLLLL